MRAFDQLADNRNRFLTTLRIFRSGDSSRDLPPLPADFSNEASRLTSAWQNYDQQIAIVLAAREPITTVTGYVTLINESLPKLLTLSEAVVADLVNAGAEPSSIALAARQSILLRGIEHSLSQILNDGPVVMQAADRFEADASLVEVQLLGMLDGDPGRGINKILNPAAVTKLLEFADLYSVVRQNVREIMDNSTQIFKIHEAALEIDAISPTLLEAASALVVAMMRRAGVTPRTFSVGFRGSEDSEHDAARQIARDVEVFLKTGFAEHRGRVS